MMYMMKLKHGDQFGKKSSSTWRLLFVFVLMPWLQKYRIMNELGKEAFEKLEMEIMSKTLSEYKILKTKLLRNKMSRASSCPERDLNATGERQTMTGCRSFSAPIRTYSRCDHRKDNESDGCLSYDDSLNQEYNHDDDLSEKSVDKESSVEKDLFYSSLETSEEKR